MILRDPFYNDIRKMLNRTLDPHLFQSCANDLLRSAYPGLVPISGGSDFGMDGAVADGLGQPFPLVCTTSENVIGNLTDNLESYIDHGGPRRRVVVATSQDLTPARRRNLNNRASEKRFELIQIHDQEDIANRLYHNPHWCKELLGLTGNPPALSIFPKTRRPLINVNLIGREKDMQWLIKNPSDRVIVGQPGVGKSFLLYQYAKENGALFVVETDPASIASCLRENSPKALIVDDAGGELDLISQLIQLRKEIGGEFSIISLCWPGDRNNVCHIMPQASIRELDPLNRDQILSLITVEMGVRAPNDILFDMVTQSSGRPGLAIVLSQLWKKGEWENVISGRPIMQEILNNITDIERTKRVLACFAIGGKHGMSLKVVAEILSMCELDISSLIRQVAVGGVIREFHVDNRIYDGPDNTISIEPQSLRHALVADTFFGTIPLSTEILEKLSKQAPSESECIRTLIGAKARGGNIPETLLQNRIRSLKTYPKKELLPAYARLNRQAAEWAWQEDSVVALQEAQPFLEHIAETILPHLLYAALLDNRPTNQFPDHPLRNLQQWIDESPTIEIGFKRRELLLRIVFQWAVSPNQFPTAMRAICLAFSPNYLKVMAHAGEGDKVIIERGLINPDLMKRLAEKWTGVVQWLKETGEIDWVCLIKLINEWVFPSRGDRSYAKEVGDLSKNLGFQMIRDLLPLMTDHPAILGWIHELNKHFQIGLDVPIDPDFETIFPLLSEREMDYEKTTQDAKKLLPGIAQRWQNLNQQEIDNKLNVFKSEIKYHLQVRLDLSQAFLEMLRGSKQ